MSFSCCMQPSSSVMPWQAWLKAMYWSCTVARTSSAHSESSAMRSERSMATPFSLSAPKWARVKTSTSKKSISNMASLSAREPMRWPFSVTCAPPISGAWGMMLSSRRRRVANRDSAASTRKRSRFRLFFIFFLKVLLSFRRACLSPIDGGLESSSLSISPSSSPSSSLARSSSMLTGASTASAGCAAIPTALAGGPGATSGWWMARAR
mmetsp:Transcript_8190/g.21005  ORF Transcript_8190/g.21005 Transcript_8190/m.21005 type:complete len:209 (-) Transcript_8190:59-685(-)